MFIENIITCIKTTVAQYQVNNTIIFVCFIVFLVLILLKLIGLMMKQMRDDLFENRGILNLVPNYFFD